MARACGCSLQVVNEAHSTLDTLVTCLVVFHAMVGGKLCYQSTLTILLFYCSIILLFDLFDLFFILPFAILFLVV
jgi:hypothetical protein